MATGSRRARDLCTVFSQRRRECYPRHQPALPANRLRGRMGRRETTRREVCGNDVGGQEIPRVTNPSPSNVLAACGGHTHPRARRFTGPCRVAQSPAGGCIRAGRLHREGGNSYTHRVVPDGQHRPAGGAQNRSFSLEATLRSFVYTFPGGLPGECHGWRERGAPHRE